MWPETLVVGSLQGITEWLPISSEGVVASVYSFLFGSSLAEGVNYALWLHLGTVFSALAAFRRDVVQVVHGAVTRPLRPSPLISYLVVSTVVSAVIGLPLLLSIEELSTRLGAAAMGLVGLLMFVTGGLQLRRNVPGARDRHEVTPVDAVIAGIGQGFAVLPGLSRSGLTVSILLARNVDNREALVLSFLMSIPASLGAGLYASVDGGLFTSGSALIAAGIASVVGFITIRALLAVAGRVNFGWFAIVLGAVIILGTIAQAMS